MMMTSKCSVMTVPPPWRSVVAPEDAGLVVVVVELRAQHVAPAEDVELSRQQHPERRRGEVQPQAREELGGNGGGERARRVHAHPRERRLDDDVRSDQGPG